ncbi:MAG: transporter, family, tetracycline resistance protein [Gaiellaceae bacterium]|nr:transporter, family, tetracycline resistance protein [Gaiellaceae bacterium]
MRRSDPTRVWYLLQGGSALGDTLVWVLAPVYFVKTVGMSPLQLVLVGTFMELTVFVFEVPTGIVADVYSRRLSTILGVVIMGLAIVLVGSIAEAWAVILGWSIWGFGYTFTSGATDAWLADEIGVANVRSVYLRSAQFARIVSLFGIAASVTLGLIALWLPIVIGGLVILSVGVALAFLMPEAGFKGTQREEVDGTWRALTRTGLTGARLVRRRPVLLLILAISASWGAWSEGYDRLSDAHLLRDVGLPSFFGLSFVVWFGLISAASLLLAIFVARPVNRRLEEVGHLTVAWVLLVLDVVLIASVVAFGLAGAFWLALIAMLLTNVARSLAMPLFSSWLNQSIDDSRVRATVMSITSQADAVGQWTGGPGIGAIGNAFGIRAALVTGAFLLSPAVALYGRAIRHGGSEPELERTAEAAA